MNTLFLYPWRSSTYHRFAWRIAIFFLFLPNLFFLSAISPEAQTSNANIDLNKDGAINTLDLLLLMQEWKKPVTISPTTQGSLRGSVFLGSGSETIQDGTVSLSVSGQVFATAPVVNGSYQFASVNTGLCVIQFTKSPYFFMSVIDIVEGENSYDIRVTLTDSMDIAIQALSRGSFNVAKTYLDTALQDNPDDPTIHFYMAVVRLLNLFENPHSGLQTVMSSLQVKIAWFLSPLLEMPEEFSTNSASLDDITSALSDTLIPTVNECLNDLAIVKNHPQITIAPRGFEKWIESYTEIDYSDVLLYEAFLHFLIAETHTLQAYKLNVNIPTIQNSSLPPDQFVISTNNLLALESDFQQTLTKSRTSVDSSLTSLKAAIQSIAVEADQQFDDLLTLTPEDVTNALDWIDKINSSLKASTSMDVSDLLGNERKLNVFLGAYFSTPVHRAQLPTFRDGHPILNLIPDPTFAGILPGMTKDQLSQFIPTALEIASTESYPLSGYFSNPQFFEHKNRLYIMAYDTLYRILADMSDIEQSWNINEIESDLNVIDVVSNGSQIVLLLWNSSTSSYTLLSFDPDQASIIKRIPLVLPDSGDESSYSELVGATFLNNSYYLLENQYSLVPINEFEYEYRLTTTIHTVTTEGKVSASHSLEMPDYYSSGISSFNGSLWLIGDFLVKVTLPSFAIQRVYFMDDEFADLFPYRQSLAEAILTWSEETWEPILILHSLSSSN